jgi:HAD superfamily hydrolase (TIGR01509 family)
VPHSGIRAVVFDLDGLIVESESIAMWAWGEVLARYGHRLDDPTYTEVLGMRVPESAAFFVNRFGLDVTPADALSQREQLFMEAIPTRLRVRPGLPALLDELDARDLPRAIATSGHSAYVQLALETVGLEARFQAIAAGDGVERGKPAPDLYLLAAHRLGISPLQCLALDDTPTGVTSASSAGLVCVAVPNRWTASQAFPGAYALTATLDEVTESLDDLLAASTLPPKTSAGTRYYEAAGGVVFQEDRVLTLQRPSREEVRLPKGHIDEGESAAEAALRETAEESGYAALAIRADLGSQLVEFDDGKKHVLRSERYFLVELTGSAGEPSSPPEQQFVPTWLGWEDALAALTFEAEREWLWRARALHAEVVN